MPAQRRKAILREKSILWQTWDIRILFVFWVLYWRVNQCACFSSIWRREIYTSSSSVIPRDRTYRWTMVPEKYWNSRSSFTSRYKSLPVNIRSSLQPFKNVIKLYTAFFFPHRLWWCEAYSQYVSRSAESATEAISLALHSVSHALKLMWDTFSVCLALSAEKAIEAISLALHSVLHRLKGMLDVLCYRLK